MKTIATPSFLRALGPGILLLLSFAPLSAQTLWTPSNLGDKVWLDWWAQDVPSGVVTSWTSRAGTMAATQSNASLQPIKSGSGALSEVIFGSGDSLRIPIQSNANLTHRTFVLLFRIDLRTPGAGASGSLFAANGVTGGVADRQPLVLYYRAASSMEKPRISIIWRTPAGGNEVTFDLPATAQNQDPNQWHCLVSRRVGDVHYASLDGKKADGTTPGESSVPMGDLGMLRNESSTGYIGDFRTSGPTIAIDSAILLQDDIGLEDAQKLMGWAMWRRSAQAQLPSNHPYRNAAPVVTPADYVYAETSETTWNNDVETWWAQSNKSVSQANRGVLVDMSGWNLVFEDNFNVHSVTNDVQGRGIWFAPTHALAAGAATAIVPPVNPDPLHPEIGTEGTPATYVHDPATGTMNLKMSYRSSDKKWLSGGFASVSKTGSGRTWKFPYVEARVKIGPSSNGVYAGMWPAVWLKSISSLKNLSQSYLEYDILEAYSGSPLAHSSNDDQHHSLHHWKAIRPMTGRLQSNLVVSNIFGLNMGNGWPQNVNLFDGSYHTHAVMVRPDYCIAMVDGREMFRFPTTMEMKYPLWALVGLGYVPVQYDPNGDGDLSDTKMDLTGVYTMTIDYVKVYQNPACNDQAIYADFSGSNGTATSDQYPGVGANGWTTAWTEYSTTDIVASVSTSTPMKDGGNYLSIVNNDTSTGTGLDTVGRTFVNANSVSLAGPHTIQFDYRLNSPASQLTGTDEILFFNNAGGSSGPGGASGFEVMALVSNGTLQWQWMNGNKAGGGTWIDSGMPVVTGTVYHFTVKLDPGTKTYRVLINNGTQTVSSGTLGYRTSNGSNLNFIGFGSRDVTSGQTINQSLDNLAITPRGGSIPTGKPEL